MSSGSRQAEKDSSERQFRRGFLVCDFPTSRKKITISFQGARCSCVIPASFSAKLVG